MLRNYLFIAAGLLLAGAAVLHFTGDGGGAVDDDAHAQLPPESANAPQPDHKPHPLIDPLVPPIRIDGLADHVLHDDHEMLFDPESLVGRVALHADFSKGASAAFHPHGEEVCASGCAASRHPTKELTVAHFHELLEQYSQEPMDETSFALESLLYFGRQTTQLLKEEGDYPLDPVRSGFLRDELKKTHAMVEVRVVDEFGEVRTWLPPTLVPLDRRHEFDMKVANVQPLETSGTVKRVGLYHVWNRL